jgi:hypothetical protein
MKSSERILDKHLVHTILHPDDDFKYPVERILTENIRDDCECPCSTGGSLPFSVILRELADGRSIGDNEKLLRTSTWGIQWLSHF